MTEIKHQEIKWKAPEFLNKPKNLSWYWINAIIGVLFLTFAIWQKNFFFAVFIVIAEVLIIYFAKNQPRILEFLLDDEGLEIANPSVAFVPNDGRRENIKKYRYEIMESFWIRPAAPKFNELIIKTKTTFNPYLKILIDDGLNDKIKEKLKSRLEEKEYENSLFDLLTEWAGF